jgi:putative cell wall-binding protein
MTRRAIVFVLVALAGVPLVPLPAAAVAPPSPRLVAAPVAGSGRSFTTRPVAAPARFDLAGLAYEATGEVHVEVRASPDGRRWTRWVTVGDAGEEGPDPGSAEARRAPRLRRTQPVWTGPARYVQFRVEGHDGPVSGLRLQAVDALGHGESLGARLWRHVRALLVAPAPSGGARPAGAEAAAPRIVSRAEWGADERLRRDAPSYGEVRLAIVHHTVSANDYTQAEAPALVRGIYAYHVRTNGWSDIGYNFLVDRFGTVYEGRAGGIDRAVIGAHAEGFNSVSFGTALLGTFSSAEPPRAMLDALARLLAWKLDLAHLDPDGTTTVVSRGSARYPAGQQVTLPVIAGHRDTGVTACPGDAAYADLGALRRAVAATGTPKFYLPPGGWGPVTGSQGTGYPPVAFGLRATEALAWTVTVSHPVLGTVRRLAASGAEPGLSWDGTGEDGSPVPGGLYRVTVEGVPASGSGTVRPATVPLLVVDRDQPDPVVRVAGPDRYATAAAASRRLAPDGARAVVVASGEADHLVDSMVAAPLARAKGAPVLLTARSSLPAPTAAELDRLAPAEAWIVGGPAAVGEEVAGAIAARGITVRRVAGPDAPATAAAVARELGGTPGGALLVAREPGHLVDGLAASGTAAGLGRPVLLVERDRLPESTDAALATVGPDRWVVGGSVVVSDAVVGRAGARRVAGEDRWATAAAVAAAATGAGLDPPTVVLASGESTNLVDALTGGGFAVPLYLTARAALPDATWRALYERRATISEVLLLGGTAAVGDWPATDAANAINAR